MNTSVHTKSKNFGAFHTGALRIFCVDTSFGALHTVTNREHVFSIDNIFGNGMVVDAIAHLPQLLLKIVSVTANTHGLGSR